MILYDTLVTPRAHREDFVAFVMMQFKCFLEKI